MQNCYTNLENIIFFRTAPLWGKESTFLFYRFFLANWRFGVANDDANTCPEDEYDCDDATCIDNNLICNNVRFVLTAVPTTFLFIFFLTKAYIYFLFDKPIIECLFVCVWVSFDLSCTVETFLIEKFSIR